MVKERGLYTRIYDVVQQIPSGQVTTYGRIAEMVGPPCDARRVGWALASLGNRRDVPPVPWQRVVGAGGKISLPGSRQRDLLEQEGVVFDEKGRIDLDTYSWEGPASSKFLQNPS